MLLALSAEVPAQIFMMLEKKGTLAKIFVFTLVGLLAFALYLIFFVNIGQMLASIKKVNVPVYLLTFITTIVEMVFFALAWQFFFTPRSTSSFKRVFAISWVSNFIDILIPAESVSGEIARIYFITRDGVDAGKATASVVTQRIVNTFIVIIALTISTLYLYAVQMHVTSSLQGPILLALAVSVILFSLLVILCVKETWAQRLIDKIFTLIEKIGRRRWNIDALKDRAKKGAGEFYVAMRTFSANPRNLILPVAFSLLSWLSGIFVYFLVFAAIGYAVDWATLIVVYTLVLGLKSVPVGSPTEIGVGEIVMTIIFSIFSVPSSISAAATILIRIVTTWFRFVIGFIAVEWTGVGFHRSMHLPSAQRDSER